jgi:hypothetical protein
VGGYDIRDEALFESLIDWTSIQKRGRHDNGKVSSWWVRKHDVR